MSNSDTTGLTPDQKVLQAEVDRMTARYTERASDGSFCGRRGLHDHHQRVLRQARARLAAMIEASSGEKQ